MVIDYGDPCRTKVLAKSAKLNKSLTYDGIKAFTPIVMLADSPQVTAVKALSPYRKLKELTDAARAKPNGISIATLGPATAQHFAANLFMKNAQISLTYIPYPGGNVAVNALLGGQVDVVLSNLADIAGQVQA